jgi:mono/diheme cytochrome c family protein
MVFSFYQKRIFMKKGFTLFFFSLLCLIYCNSIFYAPFSSPAKSLKTFDLHPGFELELVAAEPLVQDPVAMAFDENTDCWVVEMRGYMPDINGLEEDKPNGRIKILKDNDGDGKSDQAIIFLDSLLLPRAVCPVYGGVLVAIPPCLWFYERVGDQAGKRTLVDSTYAEGQNPEHMANGLILGLDNWIYSARTDKRYRLRQGIWAIESTNFRGQWGIDQDQWGHLLYNDNSTVLQTDQFPPNSLPLMSYTFGKSTSKSLGFRVTTNEVAPLLPTPGVNRGYEDGVLDATGRLAKVSAACAPSINYGLFEALPGQSTRQVSVFVAEPAANLVKCIAIQTADSQLMSGKSVLHYSKKAKRQVEFLTSKDERFRPVCTTTAPDGTLWIADMHRGIIQHIAYMTPHLRKQVEKRKLAAPVGLGRIYRVKPKGMVVDHKRAVFSSLSSTQLLEYFDKTDWQGKAAQWSIVRRGGSEAVTALTKMAINAASPLARVRALWALEGLNACTIEVLQKVGLKSNHQEVTRTALQILPMVKGTAAQKIVILMAFQSYRNYLMDIQLAASLTRISEENLNVTTPLLTDLTTKYANDSLVLAVLAGGLRTYHDAAHLAGFASKIKAASPCLYDWLTQDLPQKTVRTDLAHLSKTDLDLYHEGRGFYDKFCVSCHGKDGAGIPNLAPTLVGSGWVNTKEQSIPIKILLDGLEGSITVAGNSINLPAAMPAFRDNLAFNDGSLAKILTYIRNSWGNKGPAVQIRDVSEVRISTIKQKKSYKAFDLVPDGKEPQN